MNKLLASTALIAMLAAPAMAQTATDTTTPPATTEAPAGTMAPAEGGDMGGSPATTEMPADGAATPAPVDGAGAGAAIPTTDAAAKDAAGGFGYVGMAGDMSAETFIGKNLYVSEAEVDASAEMTEVNPDWDDVGTISDLVIGEDGQVKAVLIDIGGFLGLGAKTVAVAMDQLDVIRDGDSQNDYFIVFTADRAALESAPEFSWVEG